MICNLFYNLLLYLSVFNEGCLKQVGDTCIIIVSGTHGLDPTLLL